MKHLHKCKTCNIYTMKEICPACNKKATLPKPSKYSPLDKYGKYRRTALYDERIKENLL